MHADLAGGLLLRGADRLDDPRLIELRQKFFLFDYQPPLAPPPPLLPPPPWNSGPHVPRQQIPLSDEI
ncbi:MAG TPA: hypothetical protein VG323_00585, partial [Thermoanaerobaculia bacterium]|nr:hypothetical protein [Thermoanaerobaculia bacterium]